MWIDAAAVVKGLPTPRLHESGMQRAVPKLRAGLTHTPARLRRARLTEPAPRPSACAHRECCYGAVPDGQFHAQSSTLPALRAQASRPGRIVFHAVCWALRAKLSHTLGASVEHSQCTRDTLSQAFEMQNGEPSHAPSGGVWRAPTWVALPCTLLYSATTQCRSPYTRPMHTKTCHARLGINLRAMRSQHVWHVLRCPYLYDAVVAH